MKNYKLTILGYPVNNPSEITHCFGMLTYGLQQEFSKLSHVDLSIYKIGNPHSIPNDIPQSDFILAVSWGSFFRHQFSIDTIRSKCKYFCSFLEIPEPCDFSFSFMNCKTKESKDKYLIIPSPYTPELYLHVPKYPKTILIDHCDHTFFEGKGNLADWSKKSEGVDITRDIYTWIKPIQGEYRIYALYNKRIEDIWLPLIPPYIIPVPLMNFIDYIKFISEMEQLITPEKEGYPFTVLDMIIMGSRCLTPPTFIPGYQINRFNLPIFNNQTELLNELTKPINTELLNKNIEKCTPMNKVVEIIDTKLQELL